MSSPISIMKYFFVSCVQCSNEPQTDLYGPITIGNSVYASILLLCLLDFKSVAGEAEISVKSVGLLVLLFVAVVVSSIIQL